MKFGFYPHMAADSIRKNKRLYFPYILTCICLTAMYYIIVFLATSDEMLDSMLGGRSANALLSLGSYVIVIFSLIFIFYTNSFLVRRRKKEFGLYNILGMGKRNIALIFLWETFFIALISIVLGLAFGVLMSKLFELLLVNIMGGAVNYSFHISFPAILLTFAFYSAIFLLVLTVNLIEIAKSKPSDLIKSESYGEKPPKANWIFGLAGIVILGGAYYIAISIKEPLSAFVWFFIAVIMVIVATYLIFIAGSVTVCRLLQKSKSYYYNKRHFVSVSSMAYRMKRNGAGLASICILATMVLVMISSTACLYFGGNDAVRLRYPRDFSTDIAVEDPDFFTSENTSSFHDAVISVAGDYGSEVNNLLEYCSATLSGIISDGYLDPNPENLQSFSVNTFDEVVALYMIPLSDYNRLTGQNETLAADEVLIYGERTTYKYDTFGILGYRGYNVKQVLSSFPISSSPSMNVIPSVFVILPDYAEYLRPVSGLKDSHGNSMLIFHWYCGFDSNLDNDTQIKMYEDIRANLRNLSILNSDVPYSYTTESVAEGRADFIGIFGGLFFLGIVLSIVFILAAVLIIYYKQISEGYEDSGRFEIMQKVGMTQKDIKSSINSQLLTVFYLPLVFAGLHLCFAFPLIYRLLMLFGISMLKPLIITNLISFAVFSVLYAVVYKITSNSYYSIVSGKVQDA